MYVLATLLFLIIVFLVSIEWTRLWGAPWAPTDMAVVHKMLTMASVKPGELVYDLGSGDGRILITAARRFGARAVGFEIDPLRYLWSQLRIQMLGLRSKVHVRYGNFFKYDLGKADVINCYLLQDTNNRLAEKLNSELSKEARVVSSVYTFPSLSLIGKDRKLKISLYRGGRAS